MIDMKKQYKTRDGREVRILANDLPGNHPVAALVTYRDGSDLICRFTANGRFSTFEGPTDLIEVKPVREGWINIYPGDTECGPDNPGYEYSLKTTRSQADKDASICTRLACIKITFTEGEGL